MAGLVAAASLLLPVAAFASTNITNLTLDGGANATVDEGSTVNGELTYDITSNDDVESLSWQVVGSGLPKTCVNIDDRLNSGTFQSTFDIDTNGASTGTWDVKVTLYGTNDEGVNNLCEGSGDDNMTFSNRLSINPDSTTDNNGNNGNGNSGTSNNTALSAIMQALQAIIAKLTAPATPPASTASPACAEYASLSSGLSQGSDTRQGGRVGQLQSFLMYKGFNISLLSSNQAPYGYYGSQTASAASGFVSSNHCI